MFRQTPDCLFSIELEPSHRRWANLLALPGERRGVGAALQMSQICTQHMFGPLAGDHSDFRCLSSFSRFQELPCPTYASSFIVGSMWNLNLRALLVKCSGVFKLDLDAWDIAVFRHTRFAEKTLCCRQITCSCDVLGGDKRATVAFASSACLTGVWTMHTGAYWTSCLALALADICTCASIERYRSWTLNEILQMNLIPCEVGDKLLQWQSLSSPRSIIPTLAWRF